MVPAKFFKQLRRDLDNPQPYDVRNQQHWQAPILFPFAWKVAYPPFDLNILKVALEKPNIVSLEEHVNWKGEKKLADNLID